MIGIYGNLIYDTVASIAGFRSGESHQCSITNRTGGIANTCRALARIGLARPLAATAIGHDAAGKLAVDELRKICDVKFGIDSDRPTSQAVVLADTSLNIRTGLVHWGACRHYTGWQPLTAVSWHHFMYLDRISLPDLKEFSARGRPISVDFCDSREIFNYTHLFPHIDYLIVSELEGDSLAKHRLPVRNMIVHSPEGSYILRDGRQIGQAVVAKQNGLNVVGAGDYFAASCIANLVIDKKVDLQLVHGQTLQLLLDQS